MKSRPQYFSTSSSVKNYRTTFLSQNKRPKSQQSNPAITAILQDLASSNPSSNEDTVETAKIREKASNCSRFGSKRNSLDKQSVQTLAQDLAAECAKAYALMESSLSKLSSDLGVTPFGLAPKSKVSPCTLKAQLYYIFVQLCASCCELVSPFLCYCEIVGFRSICSFRTTFSKPLSLVLINYLVIWLKQHCSKGGDAFHKHFEFDALKKQYEPFARKLANMQISFSYLFSKKQCILFANYLQINIPKRLSIVFFIQNVARYFRQLDSNGVRRLMMCMKFCNTLHSRKQTNNGRIMRPIKFANLQQCSQ